MKKTVIGIFLVLGLLWGGNIWYSASLLPVGRRPVSSSVAAGLGSLGLRNLQPRDPKIPPGVTVAPLLPDEVSDNFDNFSDLGWLKEIAVENRAVLVGELHYYSVTLKLRNRIFFALNGFDNFPSLILENPFSTTAFVGHYLSLIDDAAAEDFFKTRMSDMVSFEEDADLLRHVRRWNRTHPGHELKVAFSDLEHDFRGTLNHVLAPYLRQADSTLPLDWSAMDSREVEKRLPDLRKALENATVKELKGPEPFMDPAWAEGILSNLESTIYSYNYDFTFYRQKAIVRNLTDPSYLGNLLNSGKVMLFGGKYHFPSNRPYPGEGGFLREGSYLSFVDGITAGRTYSIMILGGARFLGVMASIDLSRMVFQGSNYQMALKKLMRAVASGFAGPADPLIENDAGFMSNWLYDRVGYLGSGPFIIKEIDWEAWDISMAAKGLDRVARYRERDEWEGYDTHLYVASSPITLARVKAVKGESRSMPEVKVLIPATAAAGEQRLGIE